MTIALLIAILLVAMGQLIGLAIIAVRSDDILSELRAHRTSRAEQRLEPDRTDW
jgi:hypothetical protein